MSPLITTPSTRNGSAWTNTPQNTVAATLRFGLPATNVLNVAAKTANAMRQTSSTSSEPTRRRRSVWATVTDT